MPTDPRTILTSMPVHRALLDHVAPPETDLTPVDRELAGVVVSYALGSIDAGDDHREALADLLPVDRRAIAVVVRSGDESYLTPRESVIARASLSLATDPGGLTVPLLGGSSRSRSF